MPTNDEHMSKNLSKIWLGCMQAKEAYYSGVGLEGWGSSQGE
jgi:hypothetical protein